MLPRQATLEASITWSHDLLSEPERVLFRRLSVFSGGCTLDAAEAVCSDDDLVPRLSVLDLLDRLVAQSLVVLDDQPDPPRYRLLETVRQYGARRLDAAGETNPLRDRHLGHYLDTITAIRPTFEAAGERPRARCLPSPVVGTRQLSSSRSTTPQVRAVGPTTRPSPPVPTTSSARGIPTRVSPSSTAFPETPLTARCKPKWPTASMAHLVSRGDPRCAVELEQVLALGADGVHPYLVALATQRGFAIVAVARSRARRYHARRGGGRERRVRRSHRSSANHASAGLMLRGATQGDMTLARPYIDELERLRSVLPNSGLALAADISTAVAAEHVGDLARASDCLDRAEQWLAERSNPGAPALGWWPSLSLEVGNAAGSARRHLA